MWCETTRVEKRGETTRGEMNRGKRLGAKRLVTICTAVVTGKRHVFLSPIDAHYKWPQNLFIRFVTLKAHDIVSGTLKIVIPPTKKTRRKVYHYQKGDYESMRSDALRFAKERYFNGYSNSRPGQENFNLITSFIKDSVDKHIPSKTSRSVSSVPWITPRARD